VSCGRSVILLAADFIFLSVLAGSKPVFSLRVQRGATCFSSVLQVSNDYRLILRLLSLCAPILPLPAFRIGSITVFLVVRQRVPRFSFSKGPVFDPQVLVAVSIPARVSASHTGFHPAAVLAVSGLHCRFTCVHQLFDEMLVSQYRSFV
jgi:hypothetical protein